ncbi:MAG: ROK family transcriptional regulator [Anaerolineales bacterium]
MKATRQFTKEYNLRLILKMFYENEEMSRADVARATGLTKATVSELVNELIQEGLVSESRYTEAMVGKPALLLHIERNGRHLICVDLANQEFQGAVVNLRGEFLHTKTLPRDGKVGQAAIELVYQLVDALMAQADQKILGLAIGTPGLIDTTRGFVQYAVNMDWRDVPLGDWLKARYNVPVHLANDSQLAALAEAQFGDCQPNASLVAIKFGRGIGAGIVMNGQLYQGDGFGAGEIGHLRVAENGLTCRCGNTGCLETIATSRAVLTRIKEELPAHPASALAALPSAELDLLQVRQACLAGETWVVDIMHQAGRALGKVIGFLIGMLNIQNIILSGDMTHLGDCWLNTVRQSARESTLTALADATQIKLSCLTQNEVIQGASALLLARELGIYAGPSSSYRNGADV